VPHRERQIAFDTVTKMWKTEDLHVECIRKSQGDDFCSILPSTKEGRQAIRCACFTYHGNLDLLDFEFDIPEGSRILCVHFLLDFA